MRGTIRGRIKDGLSRGTKKVLGLTDEGDPRGTLPPPAPRPTPDPERAMTDQDATPLNTDEVEAVLDRIRPALQADGGDIDLVKIEQNDIYVTLVGACAGCPSATITLRMGVERLLRQEFPHMGQLIQVGGMF